MRISSNQHQHRATYDSQGDIVILPGEEKTVEIVQTAAPEVAPVLQEELIQEITPPTPKEPSVLRVITRKCAIESGHQVQASVLGTKRLSKQFSKETKTAWERLWIFLEQPVWIPGRKGKPKKYSRGTLFLMDTVRFGGTFATIFGLLFLSLNYQSFTAMIVANLDPLQSASAGQMIESQLSTSDSPFASTGAVKSANDQGSLLAILPPVGPPDNRLIIPELNLNVPIVIPKSDSLLKEDWKQLEEDIQAGLQQGVVHYPGTARPGQAGNFFVTGHSSYYPWDPGKFKSVFARLHDLKVGDEYWVYYGGDKHRYVVQEAKEVSPGDVSVLDQPTDQRRSTLMTCTPIGTALRRLIISAVEVDITTGEILKVGQQEQNDAKARPKMEMLPI